MFSSVMTGSASLYGCYKSQVPLIVNESFYICVRVRVACKQNGQKAVAPQSSIFYIFNI